MSIHKKQNGKWCVRYRTPNGKNLQKTFIRKIDAERYEREQKVAIETGAWTNPDGSRLLLSEVYDEYALGKLGLKPKSIEANRSLWEYHIQKRFGNSRIGTINVKDVHDWMKDAAQGDSAYTSSGRIQKAFKLLASILDYAVDMGYINRNSLRKSNGQLNSLKLPRNDRTRIMIALTPEELISLAPHCGRYATLILVSGMCGLRWAEVIGLQVQDIDPDGKQIVVSRTLSEVSGKFFEETTKNHQARVVQVPGQLQMALMRQIEGKGHSDLVFSNLAGSPLSSSNFRHRVFEPAIKAAGIPRITFHDLRHTAASNAIALGANILVISRMLGHSDPAVTLRYYGHLYGEDQVKLAKNIDERYSIARV